MRTVGFCVLCVIVLFCGDVHADCPPGYTTCNDGGCCSPDFPVCCWGDREGYCAKNAASCTLPGKDDDVDYGCVTGLGSHGMTFSWLVIVLPLICWVVVCRRRLFQRKMRSGRGSRR